MENFHISQRKLFRCSAHPAGRDVSWLLCFFLNLFFLNKALLYRVLLLGDREDVADDEKNQGAKRYQNRQAAQSGGGWAPRASSGHPFFDIF